MLIFISLVLIVGVAGGGLLCYLSDAVDEVIAICLIAGGLLFGIPSLVIGVEHATEKTVTFTVSDKSVNANSNSSNGHTYMIFTKEGGVYKDEDSFAFLKFNSSNVYGQLQVGHRYTCKVSGFRIPILSQTNNIISCKEVSK